MNPLPESPGMPGLTVSTLWLQPLPWFWIRTPSLRAQLRDAAAKLRVAVAVDLVTEAADACRRPLGRRSREPTG